MLERIIMCVSFLMCAVYFMIVGVWNKESMTPIAFWSGGENKLKQELKNIREYNYEMASLYRKCAFAFIIAGITSLIHPVIGLVLLGLECTVGIYFVHRSYKGILKKYSESMEDVLAISEQLIK